MPANRVKRVFYVNWFGHPRFAEVLAAHGAKVVVSSRKLPACEEVVKGIKARGGEATAVAASPTFV